MERVEVLLTEKEVNEKISELGALMVEFVFESLLLLIEASRILS